MTNLTLNNWSNYSTDYKFTKYQTILTGIYCFFFLLPSILLRRSVEVPVFGIIPISILFTGIYFILLDVITEVYGYYEAKKTLYAALTTYTLFILIIEVVLNLHLPASIPATSIQKVDNSAYHAIFDNVYVTWLAVVICTLLFDIFNIRLLSKWKFLLKGKYFIIRSILSSSFAIIMFSLVTNLFAFHHQIFNGGWLFYMKINIVSISAKLLSLIIFSYPAELLSSFLKREEKLDITINTSIFMFNKDNKE